MGSARRAIVVGVLLVLSPRESLAAASPQLSTTPASFTLVGSSAGAPDARGAFRVVVRDLAGNLLVHSNVVVDFSGCADLEICSDQLDAGASVNCIAKTTSKYTDANGSVTFIILGRSNGSGNAETFGANVHILAGGRIIGASAVSALDLDGGNGVGIDDLSVWLSDFGTETNLPLARSDFDGDGAVDINDLSVWLTAYGAGSSAQGCTTSCP